MRRIYGKRYDPILGRMLTWLIPKLLVLLLPVLIFIEAL